MVTRNIPITVPQTALRRRAGCSSSELISAQPPAINSCRTLSTNFAPQATMAANSGAHLRPQPSKVNTRWCRVSRLHPSADSKLDACNSFSQGRERVASERTLWRPGSPVMEHVAAATSEKSTRKTAWSSREPSASMLNSLWKPCVGFLACRVYSIGEMTVAPQLTKMKYHHLGRMAWCTSTPSSQRCSAARDFETGNESLARSCISSQLSSSQRDRTACQCSSSSSKIKRRSLPSVDCSPVARTPASATSPSTTASRMPAAVAA
jgi:hypothetical protein